MLYLISLGKRSKNYSEWYLDNLDKTKIKEYVKPFNKSVKVVVKNLV